ncbi:MAG: hypothetical protein BGN98_13780 [Microbacterium sp. 69-7]|uniref:hypothetical protein n=1 Tax=Microbacterium sp. 69-7 TaxID=1895784 RepID=UPI000959A8EF|nr:hypothetical protein [Microbacterium sp. 69-7]OJU44450.1 MAG: hypothetical protein BGN98_13780 [Microbacterium sp. 69-7]
MNLNEEQQIALDHVTAAQTRLLQAIPEADERARRAKAEYLRTFEIERNKAAAKAATLKVPLRRIGGSSEAGIGMRTSAVATVKSAIEDGLAYLEDAPVTPTIANTPDGTDSRFTLNGDVLTVSLTDEDMAEYQQITGSAEAGAWDFTVSGAKLLPVGGDEAWMQPVVKVVLAKDGVWEKRALEYVETKKAA